VALCREGALVRTGQAHAHGRGASGCGFRCRKRPGRESTAPPLVAGAHLARKLRENTQ
jgi:hypothetical protein